MKTYSPVVWLLFLSLAVFPGCGDDESDQDITGMSICPMACVSAGTPHFRVELTDPMTCEETYGVFRATRPAGDVCSFTWEQIPVSDCMVGLLLTPVIYLECLLVCDKAPVPQTCIWGCMRKLLKVEGNCAVCLIGQWIEADLCLRQWFISEAKIYQCLTNLVEKSAACRR